MTEALSIPMMSADYDEFSITDNDPKHPLYADEYVLRRKDETPRFLHREFILSGYRVYFSFFLCFKSLFRLHNETLNIWTHLFGLLYFTYSFISALSTLFSQPNVSFAATYLFFIFYLTSISSMFLSTVYHLCNCHCERSNVFFYRCDLLGIVLQIAGSYTVGLYYAFICYPKIQFLYGIIVGSLLIISTVVNNIHRCAGEKYHSCRSFLLASIVLFGVIPSAHWYFIATSLQYDLFCLRVLAMLGFYSLGFIFYYSHFPETCNPGKYDIWFHSHQFWHICVFLAVYIWEDALIQAQNTSGLVCVD